MLNFGQVLEFIGLEGLEKTYLFQEEMWVRNPNLVTSNVYANAPDQLHILYAGHH